MEQAFIRHRLHDLLVLEPLGKALYAAYDPGPAGRFGSLIGKSTLVEHSTWSIDVLCFGGISFLSAQ